MTNMAHQSQLENRKYRSWVKAGLGLKYTKDGLELFCDQLVTQLHVDILNKVKQKHNLTAVACGNCDIKTLQPDHVRTRSKQCPLGQTNCNCQHPRGKTSCSVCGAIYDEIIKLHASTPPSPHWKNTDAKQWCTEAWSVAKCFINAAGYEKKLKASEFDCSGLLHVLLNNMNFRDHLYCTTDGTDLLQKVLQHRNLIYHSHDMELEDEDITTYLDDMIALLQDDKELINIKHSKAAVVKLEELKREDFFITTTNETEIRRAAMADVDRIKEESEQQKRELEKKGKEESDQIVKTGNIQKTDLDQMDLDIKESIKDAVTKGKTDLTEKGDQVRDQIIGIGTKQKTDLNQKELHLKERIKGAVAKGKIYLIEKGEQVRDQIVRIGKKQKTNLNQKEIDIKESIKDAVTKGKADLTEKGDQIRNLIVGIGTKQEADLDRREVDITENIEDLLTIGKTGLADQGNQVKDEIVSTGTKLKIDLKNDLIAETTKGKLELEQKRMEIVTEFKTKLDIEQKVKRDTTIETGQTQHDLEYNQKKIRFQKKLVDNYMQYVLKVSSLPLQPERNRTDIANMYVSPWMVVEMWDENSKQTKEIEISLDEIFSNIEKLAKYIYILGEAGSGKSTLCKYLVYYWCLARRELTCTTTTIKPEAVKEMEKYDFLFYISLRHFSDLKTIENMLDETYSDPILRTILQNESDKCLILLDGLDEWTPQNQRPSQFLTQGLPARDLHAEYTIITTTRRWKFDSLQITDSEIHKKIQLKGITEIAIKDLTKTTVKQLNELFHKNKVAEDFEPDLQKSPVADISHVPMILQQLICLWFDGKLRGTSKCSVYSSMLDLFFGWKALKHSRNQVQMSSGLETDSRLPEYFSDYKACCDNTSAIYHLAHLAYKTLFNRNTRNTLTFSVSTFQQLKIPDDVKMCSLNAGILSEDLNTSLFASTRQHSAFSFVHKSMQEFLTAVHIAMQFEKTIYMSDVSRKGSDHFEENCKLFIRNYFMDCKTVVDILEQSNVFIMLCGLEPKLLPYLSEYIFNVIKVEAKMIEERNILHDNVLDHDIVLKESIQKCIVSCIQEASLGENFPKNNIYIADIVLGYTDDLIPYLHKQIFKLHTVLSLNIELSSSYTGSDQEVKCVTAALKLLTDVKWLKAFKYKTSHSLTEELDEQVAQIISRNKSTLEYVSLLANVVFLPTQIVTHLLVQIVSALSHLISVTISSTETVVVSHDMCTSLCTHLEQSVHLQHIMLNIVCMKYDEHLINLSQHKQLQYLDIQRGRIVVTSLNTNSLHTCKLHVSRSVMMNQLCIRPYNACKLKCLSLEGKPILQNEAADARINMDNMKLLTTLTSLRTVWLWWISITDNFITRPADMKNLKEINLCSVTTSMTAWCKFVDSLTKLPQNVHVYTFDLTITDTTHRIISPKNVKNKARQYVTEKTDYFLVTCDNTFIFEFLSKKTKL